MIPEWKTIRKDSRKAFVLNKPYFALAERFINLKKKFGTSHLKVCIILLPLMKKCNYLK